MTISINNVAWMRAVMRDDTEYEILLNLPDQRFATSVESRTNQ